jgi:hypothetical protein
MALIQNVATEATVPSTDAAFILDALTYILQIAFEHAIFLDRFEIDEQEPPARLAALTEQLLNAGNNLPGIYASEAERETIKAITVSTVCEVSKRIRAKLH